MKTNKLYKRSEQYQQLSTIYTKMIEEEKKTTKDEQILNTMFDLMFKTGNISKAYFGLYQNKVNRII